MSHCLWVYSDSRWQTAWGTKITPVPPHIFRQAQNSQSIPLLWFVNLLHDPSHYNSHPDCAPWNTTKTSSLPITDQWWTVSSSLTISRILPKRSPRVLPLPQYICHNHDLSLTLIIVTMCRYWGELKKTEHNPALCLVIGLVLKICYSIEY